MSNERCPNETELVSFADVDLPPEQLQRIEKHLELCQTCAKKVLALSQLLEDVAAPLPRAPLDVAEHVASVMNRLDAPVRAQGWSRWAALSGAVAVAAAFGLLLASGSGPVPSPQEFAARGAHESGSLSRDVGVQLYAQELQQLTPLGAGSVIAPGAALTAGLRNVASDRVYLLLFAVDAQQQVHWIAPEFTTAGSNPEAAAVAPSKLEQLLPSVAVFDDLAPGPLLVVAVLSRSALHVSDIEAMPAAALDADGLVKRLPRAEVRQFLLEVRK